MPFFRTLACLVCTIAITHTVAAQEQRPADKIGVQRNTPEFDTLIAPDTVIEKIATGFRWAEGPVWRSSGKYLLFSDVTQERLFLWKEGKGTAAFLSSDASSIAKRARQKRASGFSADGLAVSPDDRVFGCGHRDRRIFRIETNAAVTSVVDQFEGKRLNSPNDLVFKSNGDLYFTDPPYGLPGKQHSPSKELPFNGVYRLSKDGKLTAIIRDLSWPNGLAFSPDEKTLYVSVSDPAHAVWMAYDVKPDGTVGSGRVFYDVTAQGNLEKGLPNGLKVDRSGNIFAAGPEGVYVFNPQGRLLGVIVLGDFTTNCAWGDDGSTLYITAHQNVYRVKTRTKGVGF